MPAVRASAMADPRRDSSIVGEKIALPREKIALPPDLRQELVARLVADQDMAGMAPARLRLHPRQRPGTVGFQ